jgi:hypothetical protein
LCTDSGRAGAKQLPKFESDLMTRREAAAYLGVSEMTLAIWKSTGRYSLQVYKIGRLAKYKGGFGRVHLSTTPGTLIVGLLAGAAQ